MNGVQILLVNILTSVWFTHGCIGTIIVQEVEAAEEEDDHDDHGRNDDVRWTINDDAEGEASAMGMMSDGTQVSVWTSVPMAGERMEVPLEFVDAEHVNHDITVVQNGNEVLR